MGGSQRIKNVFGIKLRLVLATKSKSVGRSEDDEESISVRSARSASMMMPEAVNSKYLHGKSNSHEE